MQLSRKPLPANGRRACFWMVCAAALASTLPSGASPLVTSERANRHGLERVWFAQVSVDAARARVTHWTLHDKELFSLSTSGTLQALDSETGATLWTVRIGAPDGVFAGPSVNSRVVAVTSGTRLYILDRKDGHVLWTQALGGAAAAAPALSERYAFVGLMNGLVEGYPVENLEEPVWRHQSAGRIFSSPTVTGEIVCWPTDRGFLYVAQANQPRVLFRVETNEEIVAPPAEWPPFIFVPSRDGYLYCLHELSGAELWRISTGFPIISRPAAVAEIVFVASEEPALHAVHAPTGRREWSAPGATQFAALGKARVYGMDRWGGLLILDRANGGAVGRLAMGEGTTALVNDQSDRIFLVSNTGLVQCLRERDALEPTYYRRVLDQQPPGSPDGAEESPFVEEAPAEETPAVDDFAAPGLDEPPLDAEADALEEEPFEDAGGDDNPFD